MSVQRYFFRAFIRLLAAIMYSKTTIPQLRLFSEKMNRLVPFPNGISTALDSLANVPVEWMSPFELLGESVILYFHGGAWVLGLYNNHRALAANIALTAHCRVVAVDYRLAPEHPFPAALDDCLAVYQQLQADGIDSKKIIIAGDSAGANLVLALLIKLREKDHIMPRAAVCLSPLTDLAFTGKSVHSKKDALLKLEFVRSMSHLYLSDQDETLPLISPHYADLSGLPPLLVQAGENEILLSDAERLAEHATRDGIDVSLEIWPKMWHVWHVLAPFLPEAKQAIEQVASFIRKNMNE